MLPAGAKKNWPFMSAIPSHEILKLVHVAPDGAPEARVPARESAVVDQVLNALPSGILVTGADGVIRLANPAGARILGQDSQHLVGRKLTHVRGEYEAMMWPTDKGEVLLLDSLGPGRVLGFTSRALIKDDERDGVVIAVAAHLRMLTSCTI